MRGSRLVKVPGMIAWLLRVPSKSIRPPIRFDEDTAYVDKRRLKRMKRRKANADGD
jgi:hypothetical protein